MTRAADDYEQGEWTPRLTADSGFTSVQYDQTTVGVYQKRGRVVEITGWLRTDAIPLGNTRKA